MFEGLQKKWKVGGLRLFLIIFTFAIGGSVTGLIAKKIMNSLTIGQDWLWAVIYILLITIIWPLTVLIVSIPFGQFRFFKKYIKKIGTRMGIGSSQEFRVRSSESELPVHDSRLTTHNSQLTTPDSRLPTQLAVFASGTGSNTQMIIDYFRNSPSVKVALIVSNNPAAGVLKIAAKENIPALTIEKEKFFRDSGYLDELKEKNIDLIVLAGFLWKLPSALIHAFPKRIINIHPALLPKHGGKGMYGNNVHAAVIASGEKESGITIHYVDEHYDNGDIILQVTCPVLANDTPGSLAERIHALEHGHYPKVIEELVNGLIR